MPSMSQLDERAKRVVTRKLFLRAPSRPPCAFSNHDDQMSFTCLTPSETRREPWSIFSSLASTVSPASYTLPKDS